MKLPTRLALAFLALGLINAPAAVIFSDDFNTNLDDWTGNGTTGATQTIQSGDARLFFPTSGGGTRRSQITTDMAYTGFNFTTPDNDVTLTLTDIAVNQLSAGAVSIWRFGFTPDSNVTTTNLQTRDDSIYFQQVSDTTANLILRDGGSSTTLATIGGTNVSFNYESIELNLTNTSWSLTLDPVSESPFNTFGTFASAPTWVGGLYSQLQIQAGSAGGQSSYEALFNSYEVTAIPEPSTAMLVGLPLLFALARKRQLKA